MYARTFHQSVKKLWSKDVVAESVKVPAYAQYKQYPRLDRIPLNFPEVQSDFFKIIRSRVSRRTYTQKPCAFDYVGAILGYSAGVVDHLDGEHFFPRRCVPSAGALNPLEVYVLVVCGDKHIPAGLYHYDSREHVLEILPTENTPEVIMRLIIKDGGEWSHKASFFVFHTVVFHRNTEKYPEKGYQFALFESGAMMQNIYLVGEALGLGVCAIGGVRDMCVEEILGIDGVTESLINTIVVGSIE